MNNEYLITFLGYGAMGVSYESSIEIQTPYNWSHLGEVEELFFLIDQTVRKDFERYKILSIELI